MATTLPEVLPETPMAWAGAWLDEATSQQVQRNPNSMTLATADEDGQPSSRVVLCKAFIADPGFVVFYTNYRSRKVAELLTNSAVAVNFHWDALGRQIRLEGQAVMSPQSESDAYFASRHWGSQIGAWGSDQSAELESRQALFRQVRERARSLGVAVADDLQTLEHDAPATVPRPPHWGGIRVWPHAIELWIEGADRIHDRGRWTRSLTPNGNHEFDVGPWTGKRLQP